MELKRKHSQQNVLYTHPDFNLLPRTHTERLEVLGHVCLPITGEAEMDRSMVAATHPA